MRLNLDKSQWRRVSFGDVVRNVNEYFSPARDGVLPYLAGPHLDAGVVTPRAYGSTEDDHFPPTFKRRFQPDDVLLHSRGVEKLAVTDRPGVTGEKLFVLRSTDGSKLEQRFLVWLLLGRAAQSHMQANFTGSVNKFLNWKPLAGMEVDLPPLHEQLRLAGLLWAIESHRLAVAEAAHRFNEARALWRGGTFQSSATTVRLDERAEVTLGRQRAPQHAAGDHMRYYVRSANVTNGRISLDDINQMNFTPVEQERFRLIPGDVLVSEGTASPRELGSSATWDPDDPSLEMYFQKTLLRLRARTGLSTPVLLREWAAWAQESGAFLKVATGTGILHITGVRCAAMPFPVMTPVQQEDFERISALMSATATSVQRELNDTALLRASILGEIFGGN